MSNQHQLIVVDDEPANLALMKRSLNGYSEVEYLDSGSKCIEFVSQHVPDVILLDANMPEMDGYEVCQTIKNNEDTKDVQIIFVSALDSLEQRMQGYEAGADDYVTKPFDPEELLAKITLALNNKEEREKLAASASSASNIARVAMTTAGEMGVVLQFMKASFQCSNFEELADALLDALSAYGLHCAVQLRGPEEVVNKDYSGVCKPLVIELMERMRSLDRIYDFGSRTVISFDAVSILIKNMPMDDPDKYGRIKDNVALLAEGAESRLLSIVANANQTKHHQSLLGLFDNVRNAVIDIDEKHKHHKDANGRIMEDLMDDVETCFFDLGLTEEQEKALLEIINLAANKANALYDSGLDIEQRLDDIAENIKQAIEFQG